jgi:hypothetical protein
MREFSDLSIANWVDFIRSFTKPKHDKGELWSLSKDALLSIKLEILKPQAQKKERKPKKSKDDAAEGEAEEEDDQAKRIRYKPNLKECEDFMIDCLEQMRKTTNEFLCLEKDLVTFLNLPDKSSFELSPEFVWINDAKQQIKTMFAENQIAPTELLDQYKKYEYILNVSKTKLINNLFKKVNEDGKESKATFEEISETIYQFHSHEYEILKLSNDSVDFPVFQVKAKDLKERLAKEANSIKHRLCEQVYSWCNSSVKHISSTFDDMQKRIAKVPDNEEELVELREFIK